MDIRDMAYISYVTSLGMVLWLFVKVDGLPDALASPYSSLLQPNIIPPPTHDFKHSDRPILTGPNLMRYQVIVRCAPEKIRSGLADIGGIDRISIAIW